MNVAMLLLGSFFSPSMRVRQPLRVRTFLKPYDPRINRHTGKPHEHKREIARRLRQNCGGC